MNVYVTRTSELRFTGNHRVGDLPISGLPCSLSHGEKILSQYHELAASVFTVGSLAITFNGGTIFAPALCGDTIW